jgi:DNA-binding MarR family transcriptional regulator
MPLNHVTLTSEACLRAFHMVQLFRSTGEHEFPAPLMAIFFWVAAHDGCKQADLSAHLEMSQSSISRNVTWLGPKHRLEHRSGLKLVRRERDPNNYKAWLLYLTPKGRVFRQLLEGNATKPIDSYKKALKEIQTHDKTDEDLG